jgi:hypothetical protein
MAMPVNFDPKQSIYHVIISMGSPFQVNSSKDIDEYKRELNYKRPKETRRKIGAIRQQVNARRAFSCVPFFGAFFTNALDRKSVL